MAASPLSHAWRERACEDALRAGDLGGFRQDRAWVRKSPGRHAGEAHPQRELAVSGGHGTGSTVSGWVDLPRTRSRARCACEGEEDGGRGERAAGAAAARRAAPHSTRSQLQRQRHTPTHQWDCSNAHAHACRVAPPLPADRSLTVGRARRPPPPSPPAHSPAPAAPLQRRMAALPAHARTQARRRSSICSRRLVVRHVSVSGRLGDWAWAIGRGRMGVGGWAHGRFETLTSFTAPSCLGCGILQHHTLLPPTSFSMAEQIVDLCLLAPAVNGTLNTHPYQPESTCARQAFFAQPV